MIVATRPSAARFFSLFRDYSASSKPYACPHISTSRVHFPARQAVGCTARPFHTSQPQRSQRESLGPQTHYDLFPTTLSAGPPPRGPFYIDARELRKEFLQLQAKTHPDLHSGKDKARAEGLSAMINEAYKTLQNPLLRTQYLLSLRGIDVAEDETMKVEDPELLMEVLEMRETIETVEEEAQLEPLKAVNDQKVLESIKVLDEAFKDDDMQAAKEEAVRLRYWVNIDDSLNSWEKGKPVVLVH